MATVLVVAKQDPSILSKFEITAVIVALSVLVGFLFSFAKPISSWLGEAGMGVVTRVMGMVLATIAIGMMTDGLKGLMPGLAA
jgi:multiple antibiotic resistance protein